jgi:hypothetical protein
MVQHSGQRERFYGIQLTASGSHKGKDMEIATDNNSVVSAVDAVLGFSRPDEVDAGRNDRGLRRAVTRPLDMEFSQQFEYRHCRVRDWSAPDQPDPELLTMGFEAIDLSPLASLQSLLADLRAAGEISGEQARQLRRELTGRLFPLAGGKCLKLLNIAPEGLIMRKGGPNGLKLDEEMREMNGHPVAMAIHGDQDVRGTPLKQIMRGFAPWMFRHRTPDGSNRLSPLVLVNLWIPLQQLTQPLTLVDRRTVNARNHQLQYALPTETFLDRSEDMRFNDIWAFLHDDAQQWYFRAGMDHRQAYVFDTLGEAHGAFTQPGEVTAEYYYRRLQDQCAALDAGRTCEPAGAAPELPADTPLPLRAALASIARLAADYPGQHSVAWRHAAVKAMDSMVRKSLEMRVVAVLLPGFWPFNRHRVG